MCCALAGCAATTPAPATAGSRAWRERNEGYSILYKLLSVDSDVENLFILKSANPELTKTVRAISALCRESKAKLEEFARADPSLDFDMGDLPAVEIERRNLMTDADRKELLTLSGREFEVRLIVTQQQAMEYASQLSLALARRENDPGRKKKLIEISRSSRGFAEGLGGMLGVKS
jgi:hypothetical protein